MFQGLIRLRDQGFAPTGILDVAAYQGDFWRGARQVFSEAYILMIDALAEKEPALKDICREVGNADCLIEMLGEKEMEASPFFVVNAQIGGDVNKTGSSKFREASNFPVGPRMLPQRTLGSVVGATGQTFEMLKLDVQGAELEVPKGSGSCLSNIEVILMEISLVDYNKGAPLIDVVLSELGGMGFVLTDIVEER